MPNTGEDPLQAPNPEFPPPHGGQGIHCPLRGPREPRQVSNIPDGVNAPVLLSISDFVQNKTPAEISEGRSTAVEEEGRLYPDSDGACTQSSNQSMTDTSKFVQTSTLLPREDSFNCVSRKTATRTVSSTIVGPRDEPNKDNVIAKDANIANTFATGSGWFKSDKKEGNISSYSANVAGTNGPSGPSTTHGLFHTTAELNLKMSNCITPRLRPHFHNWHGLTSVPTQIRAVDPHFTQRECSHQNLSRNQSTSRNNTGQLRELKPITLRSHIEEECENPGPSTRATAPRGSRRNTNTPNRRGGTSSSRKRNRESRIDDPAIYALLTSPRRTRSGAIYKSAAIPGSHTTNKRHSISPTKASNRRIISRTQASNRNPFSRTQPKNRRSISRTQANNRVGRDGGPQSPVSEQPVQHDLLESNGENSYLNRVYFAYVKKRAEMEAIIEKSQDAPNRCKQEDTLEIPSELGKNEIEDHTKTKPKVDVDINRGDLETKQQLFTSKSMSADQKRRVRLERNRLSAKKSREGVLRKKVKCERLAYAGRIENEAKKKAVLSLKNQLEEMQTRLLKKMDIEKLKETCPILDEMLHKVDYVIADSQWTFRPEDIRLVDLHYLEKSK